MREQDYYERGYDDEPRRSKKAKKRKRKQSGSRGERVVVTLLSLLFLTVAVVATVKYVVRAPEPVTDNEDQQTQQDGTAEDSDAIQTISNGRERKSKYCYNILLYGVDNDAGGSDTNMLMRFDAVNKTVDVVSLPRDTLMSNGHKLNSSYNNGGTEKLRSNIEDMLGVPVDFYVSVDLKGFITLIDQIDGVDFDVPEDMDYDDPYQDLHIHQEKGYRLLTGDDAMQVLRYRHDNRKNGKMLGYPDGDLGRIKTQQGLLKAMIEQLMSLKNITKVNEFIKVFNENVETDLSFQNMLWFAKQAFLGNSSGAKLDTAQVNFVTMPNKNVSCWSRVYHSYQSYVTPNAQELLELVNNELSPFVEPSTMSDLDIMSVNKDGSVSSTTGHVEDSKAAVPPTLMGSGKKDEPEKGYITDENGNLIDPDTGEIVSPPEETEPGTETPSEPTPETPATPETPGTGTETTDPSGSTGGETGTGSPETPDQPEDPGIIVVPPEEPATPDANQGLDPVTGEPLPMGG